MAGVLFDAHYHITTVDPPELVQFIKRQYPQVERHHPEKSMWELVVSNGWPPTRLQRYCCRELKETGGAGRLVLTGVRWAESNRRRSRRMTESCSRDGTKTYLHPIIDWTNEDVWEFIGREQLAYCSLYDEGFTRLGCVLCPQSTEAKRDIARWPKIAAQYVRTFQRVIEMRKVVGKRCSFDTGRELFDWWIQRHAKGRAEGQMVLFE